MRLPRPRNVYQRKGMGIAVPKKSSGKFLVVLLNAISFFFVIRQYTSFFELQRKSTNIMDSDIVTAPASSRENQTSTVTLSQAAAAATTTSIEEETFSSCKVSKTLPMLMSNYSHVGRSRLEDFMVLDQHPALTRQTTAEPRPYATCRFGIYLYYGHHPHFLQQFLRCWSYWESHPNHQPVLLEPKKGWVHKALTIEFTRGYMNLLRKATKVIFAKEGGDFSNITATLFPKATNATRLTDDTDSVSAKPIPPIMHWEKDHFQVANVQHTKSFKSFLLSGLNLTIPPACATEKPTIAFLNRKKKPRYPNRKVYNAEELVEDLQSTYNISSVVYFENKDFREQVRLMSTWDIVLTPHGAQETSIFMMRDCGGVVEIQPQNYYFPKFFGTLAATAGIHHAVLHNTNNDPEFNETSPKNYWLDGRNVDNFCPTRHAVKEALDAMIHQWRLCCATGSAAATEIFGNH